MNKFIASLAIGAMTLAAPVLAVELSDSPITITMADVGKSFTYDFNGIIEGDPYSGLTASIQFTLTGVSGGLWAFSAQVMNTADGSIWDDARISAMGFTSLPDVTAANYISGPFDGVDLGGNFPQVGTDVSFCFTAGSNCSGGAGGGVTMDNTPQTQVFNLDFAGDPTSVTLNNFIIRWQSLEGPVNGGSGIGLGEGSGGFDGGGGPGVPEPASWAMLIAGFGLVGAVSRRRKASGLTVAA